MFNKLELQAALARKGKTFGDLAKYLGMAQSTMSAKANGKTEFTRKEIQMICEFLDLETPMAVFFDDKLKH